MRGTAKRFCRSVFLKIYILLCVEEVMTSIITNKKEIQRIILEKIKGKKLIFSKHYHLRLAERGMDHEKVKEIFQQFEKVFAIEEDILKYGDKGYEFFYSLSNNITFSIATVPKGNAVDIIHAVEYKRSLRKRLSGKK